ncbi:MAG TPA: patatin-like phospholipase family protein [Vicinamibacterales bacterium]|nr:patatin-like phospholipase family protein [Vicinamibacterales bacterium]
MMTGDDPHARRSYVPLPKDQREGIALCLSGGGFRAALFHLGALRRLNELGILSQIKTVTAVSGGTMIAAHLAHNVTKWRPGPMSPSDWDQKIAEPFRRFASRNLGTWPVVKGLFLPWTNEGVELLARRCDMRLGLSGSQLKQLEDGIDWSFCAVNLVTGKQYVLSPTFAPEWPIALSAAVSSCFPVLFSPYRQTTPQRIALVDGGVDDNLGVEPVWRNHEVLLVSDGGDALRSAWSRSVLSWIMRAAFVTWNQGQDVRKRWLLANFIAGTMNGAYWGIDSSTAHYPTASSCGYSTALSRDLIAPIRTTYDAFSDAEAAVLENHGYFLAEAAASSHLGSIVQAHTPMKVPHPAWLSEGKIREGLRNSASAFPPRW